MFYHSAGVCATTNGGPGRRGISLYWKNEIAPRVPRYLDRPNIVVTRIIPTPKSTVR
jgi:hypothetical protein